MSIHYLYVPHTSAVVLTRKKQPPPTKYDCKRLLPSKDHTCLVIAITLGIWHVIILLLEASLARAWAMNWTGLDDDWAMNWTGQAAASGWGTYT